MEIVHIVLGKANPERMNGVNKVVYQLATKQAEFGEQVAVWGITADTQTNYGERNFETRLFLKSSNPFVAPSEIEKAMIEKKGNAIFHIHGGWIPVFYTITKLLYKHKLPYVFTPHGAYNVIAMQRSFLIKKIYFILLEKKILQLAFKIHCIGKSETIALNDLFNTKKTVLLPYGYENSTEIILEKAKSNSIIYGFIGRLDIYTKGLDTLVAAFKKHLKQNSNAQLWIIGDSNEKEKLSQMILAAELQKNVTLFGRKFGKEKDDLLHQMDVFIHPSRNEGLPTSVIEAASFGKPCIVTDATNIGDLVTEYRAGITIFEQNSDVLEHAMNNVNMLWNNQQDFKQMRCNAINMVKDNFNWKKITQEFNLKLYEIK
jgi:glycosyltransferase involved in cell wall biosynthesis